MEFLGLKSIRRSYLQCVTAILCLLLLGPLSAALRADTDTPQAVPESEALQHLIQHPDPIYPAIARAVGIEGDVKISVVINAAGNVISQKILSGPPMLRQSALDATKKWQFKPFETDGIPTDVSTTLTVGFHPENHATGPTASQEEAAQAWFPLSDKCRASLKGRNTHDSLNFCKAALDMSLRAGHLRPSDQLAMLESHQNYGHALLAAGRLQKAFKEENEAVDAAKSYLKDSDNDYAWPFYWRAVIEGNLGNYFAASADLSVAEKTYRKAIKQIPELDKVYNRDLAAILRIHAALLDRMGELSEAAKLRGEADSL